MFDFDQDFMNYVGYQIYGGGSDPSYDLFRDNNRFGFDPGLDYMDLLSLEDEYKEKKKLLDHKLKHSIIIVIHYDAGYGNTLYIRGNTSPLSWNRGQKCKNVNANTWVYEMECRWTGKVEFKILINDSTWENGYNHSVETGYMYDLFPSF